MIDCLQDITRIYLQILRSNIYICSDQFGSFSPNEIDFFKYIRLPKSPTIQEYQRRDEYKTDLNRISALIQAATKMSSPKEIFVDLQTDRFILPTIASYADSTSSSRVRVPAGQKVVLLSHPDQSNDGIIPNSVCLFPGRVESTEDGKVYISTDLSRAIEDLNQKKNYSLTTPILSFNRNETLDTLRDKMTAYLRAKIKSSLRRGEHTSLYRIADGDDLLPLERLILDPESTSAVLDSFLLLLSNLDQESTVYVDEASVDIQPANKYLSGDQEGRFIILNPILASHEPTSKYNFPISVPLRALHLNYAYQVISDEYEDFLGEANWILCPLVVFRSKGTLHGRIEILPSILVSEVETCSSETCSK